MHLQDINTLLNLQDIKITQTSEVVENKLVITVEPLSYIQPCPCCHSSHVIRKGAKGYRSVRLKIGKKKLPTTIVTTLQMLL